MMTSIFIRSRREEDRKFMKMKVVMGKVEPRGKPGATRSWEMQASLLL